jgi:hypothetical protein
LDSNPGDSKYMNANHLTPTCSCYIQNFNCA